MPRIADTRCSRKFLLTAMLFVAPIRDALCQDTKAQLGLRSSGGVAAFVGGGRAVHDLSGGEFGALLDLGWIWTPRVRLVGDASWFIGTLKEYVAQDDRDFSGAVFDLSSTVSLLALSGNADSRQTAYASLGFSIHALSSSFRSLPLDQRYNANRFGFAGAIGGRFWLGDQGRQALFVELRETRVAQLDRWTVRSGFMHNFGPLARPKRH